MKSLQIDFTPEEFSRLERVVEMHHENEITVLAKLIVMNYVRRNELQESGHYPRRPHPSAFRRQEGEQ